MSREKPRSQSQLGCLRLYPDLLGLYVKKGDPAAVASAWAHSQLARLYIRPLCQLTANLR